jgi:Domain of unknown function (DUF1707)
MNTELRVGDAERDEVTAALHEHFAQGRLTRDELDERLTATLSAKTVGDLRAVTRDLPGASPERASALAWRRDPWEPGAAHWGRGPLAPAGRPWPWPAWGPPHGRGPRPGWGPPGRRPFGPLPLVALAVAAFTGWWMIFPVLFCVWFAAAFTVLRYTRRRHRPITPRR